MGDDLFDGAATVRYGAGFLPLAGHFSPEEQERQRRAAEAEERRWQLEREQVAEDMADKAWALARQGHEPMSVAERLAGYAAGQDRQDRRDAARQHVADCGCSSCDNGDTQPAKPLPAHLQGLTPRELRKTQADRKAEAETTPATKADVGKLQGQIQGLKAKLWAATGRK